MITTHNLGFPRIGIKRELKKALEAYWQNKIDQQTLIQTGQQIRQRHWQLQADAGLDLIPVGDFSFYDQILDMSCLLGAVPPRFENSKDNIDLDQYFAMARGLQNQQQCTAACEMTKWFNSNYHYLVPEVRAGQKFKIGSQHLFDQVKQALSAGFNIKAVIIGPLTWLWLAKAKDEQFDKLQLLNDLIQVYKSILAHLQQQGVKFVQIDEPILCLDLPAAWQQAFIDTYRQLQSNAPKLIVATYFASISPNLKLASRLAIAGLHLDLVHGSEQIEQIKQHFSHFEILSLGIIDGRNIWRTDLDKALKTIQTIRHDYPGNLWLAPSCSLLHVPIDLELEKQLDSELKTWLAFARQKLAELNLIKKAICHPSTHVAEQLQIARQAISNKKNSGRIHKAQVKQRLASLDMSLAKRNSQFATRIKIQKQKLKLPLLPTTTIGSFPQTREIRAIRRQYKQQQLSTNEYIKLMQNEIADNIRKQEQLGLDVLVHGEPERNDMVEYFAEHLSGFAFTEHAWVQSYGSRCVKPPIIFADIYRHQAITVDWIAYAQSCTDKPVKGMLTGPTTILNWSFVRNDQPRWQTAQQIALALHDEVIDLENAGIKIIQIDEAALREGLPLHKKHWAEYLDWAVKAFRLVCCGAKDETQIHTHMCYSEFNDIIEAIAAMDADVISIESARSQIKLLDAFKKFEYPNEIGPGVYDIHSPNIPSTNHINNIITQAATYIPLQRLWINPDCGLKTRKWQEVEQALKRMVESALQLRTKYRTQD